MKVSGLKECEDGIFNVYYRQLAIVPNKSGP